jgi:simple sugar transport system permease protein
MTSRPVDTGSKLENQASFTDNLKGIIDRSFIWVLLIIIGIGATALNPVFASWLNVFNILLASAALGCLVLGQAFPLILGEIDLSTEASMIFVAIVGGHMMMAPAPAKALYVGGLGVPWPLALLAMLALSTLIGFINGQLIVRLRVTAFMQTLAMMVFLTGLSLVVSRGRHVTDLPRGFRFIGGEFIGPVPVAVIFMLLFFFIVHIALSRTTFGRSVYAVGSNRLAARAAGIDDVSIKITAFTLAGFFAGLASYLLVGRLGAASAAISSGQLFISIASCVLGGVSLTGGRGTVPGMLGGLLVMSTITNALNMADIPPEYFNVATGAVILVAIVIDAARAMRLRTED